MMTSNFPLMKLPLIAQELIVQKMNFLDLLRLCMKSTRFKRHLELLKLPVCSLHLFVTKEFYGISIIRNRDSSYIETSDSVPVDTITELVNIQRKPMEILKNGKVELKVKSNLSKLATMETIVKYILSFSKVAKYSLKYDDTETDIRSLFIWQLATKLDEFNISPYYGITISPEILAFILDDVSIKCLFLNVSCPGFKYQRPIRHPVINIKCPSWIDFDQFSLGPKTITADFSDQKVSNAILNRLIKDWAEGKCPKLRKVEFTWRDNNLENLAMAQEYATRPPKPVLPNRSIEQLKGLSINHQMKHRFWAHSVYYELRLSVEKYSGLNGIHLDDRN